MPDVVGKPADAASLVAEAWAQGFMVGALIIMACITAVNLRRGVLLHQLIVLELLLGTFHGTFIFTDPPTYHWYLSATAISLNVSWTLHNVIAWMKNKPFFEGWQSKAYIGTVILVQPYWVLEVVANFLYYSGRNDLLFARTRVLEMIFRDPWWVLTIVSLIYNIIYRYEFGLLELVQISPRFGILIGAMFLSIVFMTLDILAAAHVFAIAQLPDGLNPFWKLSFVFKCLTDTIILDDFKTALDRLREHKIRDMAVHGFGSFLDANFTDVHTSQFLQMTRPQASFPPRSINHENRDWCTSQNEQGFDDDPGQRADSASAGAFPFP